MANDIELWPLSRTCAAFAKQHNFAGVLIVASDGENGSVRLGCHGMSFDETERALCLALYYNTKQGLERAEQDESVED